MNNSITIVLIDCKPSITVKPKQTYVELYEDETLTCTVEHGESNTVQNFSFSNFSKFPLTDSKRFHCNFPEN